MTEATPILARILGGYMAFVLPLVRPAWAQLLWGAGTVLLGLWLLWAGL